MNTPKDIAGRYISSSSCSLFIICVCVCVCPRVIILGSHAGAEWTPESANFSVVDEQDAFPSPPHDLDFYAVDPNGIDLSQVYKHTFLSRRFFLPSNF